MSTSELHLRLTRSASLDRIKSLSTHLRGATGNLLDLNSFEMKTTRPILPTPATSFTTPRLLLRPMETTDLNHFHALRTQIEVMKWTSTGRIDVDIETTTKWMERFLPPNDSKTFSFAIEELANPGTVVGTVAMHVAEPPECGYMVRKEVWGNGFATEALTAWLQEYWKLPRRSVEIEEELPECKRAKTLDGFLPEVLRALIETNHAASRRVLEKCGFKQYGREEVEDSHYPGEGKLVWLDYYCCERPQELSS